MGSGGGSARQSFRVVVVALVLAIGTVGGVAGASHQFDDVPDDNPFHDDVGWMADLGITGGFADGGFHPGATVTRQSMAAFLHRLWLAVGEEDAVPPLPGPSFSDVPASHAFHDDIIWMADLGITGGFPDGTFRPTLAVRRQAMATFRHRFWLAVGMDDPPTIPDPGFTDVPPDHPFFSHVA